MECKFHIGQPVICVDQELQDLVLSLAGVITIPQIDEKYHIRSIRACTCPEKHILVTVREIVNQLCKNGLEYAFIHTVFRALITPEEFMEKDTPAPVDSVEREVEHV